LLGVVGEDCSGDIDGGAGAVELECEGSEQCKVSVALSWGGFVGCSVLCTLGEWWSEKTASVVVLHITMLEGAETVETLVIVALGVGA